jgi:hypothetical protein
MKVRQISVFIENRAGRLETVARLLGEAGINIRALALADTSDFGILRLIVSQPHEAQRLLKANRFTIKLTDVIAVEVPDTPGGLARVLGLLGTQGMNVEYMYGFVEKTSDQAVLVFRFDDLARAIDILQQGGVRILKEEEVLKL